jgi:hypothetical protein
MAQVRPRIHVVDGRGEVEVLCGGIVLGHEESRKCSKRFGSTPYMSSYGIHFAGPGYAP